ncbi:MAG TPA: hypothetical protein VK894_08745 [Jiangellales bacterium]|nr:hypothetical protein [Jiangellales bacterium]
MAGDTFGNVSGPVQTGDGVQYAAGRDQNVAHGDQYVAGRDQVVHAGPGPEVLAELAALRQELAGLRLTAAERDGVEADVAAMEAAAAGEEPDRPALGRHLESLTETLKDAGALASAGSGLVETILRLASWLGPLGAGVLALL